MTIYDKIRQNYCFLSNKQKSIADYFLENNDNMSFRTLKQISIAVSVTEVTIISFCKNIGFSNFREMKEGYKAEISERISPTKKIFASFGENETAETLFPKVIELQIQNHSKTLYRINEKELKWAIELITGANKIYIFYRGSTEFAASHLKMRFDNLALQAEIIDTSVLDNRFFMNSMRFTKDDLYIFFSYPVYSGVLLKFCEFFKSKEFPIISFTDKYDSAINKYSDIAFITDNDSPVFFNSYQSLISIIEILLTLLHNRLKDKLLGYKQNVEKYESEFSDFMFK